MTVFSEGFVARINLEMKHERKRSAGVHTAPTHGHQLEENSGALHSNTKRNICLRASATKPQHWPDEAQLLEEEIRQRWRMKGGWERGDEGRDPRMRGKTPQNTEGDKGAQVKQEAAAKLWKSGGKKRDK